MLGVFAFLEAYNNSLSVNDVSTLPETIVLHPLYPNPFNPATNISYSITEVGNVNLTVYDMLGREIYLLYNDTQMPGYHTISWDASEQSSGIYFVKIISGEYVSTQKLVLMK